MLMVYAHRNGQRMCGSGVLNPCPSHAAPASLRSQVSPGNNAVPQQDEVNTQFSLINWPWSHVPLNVSSVGKLRKIQSFTGKE